MIFRKLYIYIVSSAQDLFYYFNSLCFQQLQNVTWTDELRRMIRHRWSKIGPPYLLSEHGDLSFLLCSLKQCLVGNIQKFQKNCSVTFISEESIKNQILKCQLGSALRHTYTDRTVDTWKWLTGNMLQHCVTVWLCYDYTMWLLYFVKCLQGQKHKFERICFMMIGDRCF